MVQAGVPAGRVARVPSEAAVPSWNGRIGATILEAQRRKTSSLSCMQSGLYEPPIEKSILKDFRRNRAAERTRNAGLRRFRRGIGPKSVSKTGSMTAPERRRQYARLVQSAVAVATSEQRDGVPSAYQRARAQRSAPGDPGNVEIAARNGRTCTRNVEPFSSRRKEITTP